jgi:hypothetical protein
LPVATVHVSGNIATATKAIGIAAIANVRFMSETSERSCTRPFCDAAGSVEGPGRAAAVFHAVLRSRRFRDAGKAGMMRLGRNQL